MHRLFVAIRPPAAIRAQLLDLMEGVNGARWQDEDQLHLTLRFIGEVDRHQAADIAAALGAIRHPAFALSLDGMGSFTSRGRPTSLWAGVKPHAPLHALHKKVDQAVQRAGIAPDRRAYAPHITLARINRSTGPLSPLLEKRLASGPFPVEDFRLYESELGSDRAVYSVVERYSLMPH